VDGYRKRALHLVMARRSLVASADGISKKFQEQLYKLLEGLFEGLVDWFNKVNGCCVLASCVVGQRVKLRHSSYLHTQQQCVSIPVPV
jgi:hypothetical protein